LSRTGVQDLPAGPHLHYLASARPRRTAEPLYVLDRWPGPNPPGSAGVLPGSSLLPAGQGHAQGTHALVV
ncbi:MAG TPA: hypothetical protein DCM14_00365, partial [Clostridiales bacterium UBA8153]|nr:hypothetical protein [Clostridiales bacterium UBA8153]